MKNRLTQLACFVLIVGGLISVSGATNGSFAALPTGPVSTPQQLAQVSMGSVSDRRAMQVVATRPGFVVTSGAGNLRAYSADGTPAWSHLGMIASSSADWAGFGVAIEAEFGGRRILVSWALKDYSTPAFLIDTSSGAVLWQSSNAQFLSNGAPNSIEPNGNGNVAVAAGPATFALAPHVRGGYFQVFSLRTGRRVSRISSVDTRVPQRRRVSGITIHAVHRAFIDKSSGFVVRVNDLADDSNGSRAYLGVTVRNPYGKPMWSRLWKAKGFYGQWRGSTFDKSSLSAASVVVDGGQLTLAWEPWVADRGRDHRQFSLMTGRMHWRSDWRRGLIGSDAFSTWSQYAGGARLQLLNLEPPNDGKNHANDFAIADGRGRVHRIATGCKILEGLDRYGAPVFYWFLPHDVSTTAFGGARYFFVAMTCVTSGSFDRRTSSFTGVRQRDILFAIDATQRTIAYRIPFNSSNSEDIFGVGYDFGSSSSGYGQQPSYFLSQQGLVTAFTNSTATYLGLYPMGSPQRDWRLRPSGWGRPNSATSFALGNATVAVLTQADRTTNPLVLTLYR